jgi:hypothetical protein
MKKPFLEAIDLGSVLVITKPDTILKNKSVIKIL